MRETSRDLEMPYFLMADKRFDRIDVGVRADVIVSLGVG